MKPGRLLGLLSLLILVAASAAAQGAGPSAPVVTEPEFDGQVESLAVSGGTLYAGAATVSADHTVRFGVVALDTSSGATSR